MKTLPILSLRILVGLIFLCLTSSCGRKQKNFLMFKEEDPAKITKLALPAVRGVEVKKIVGGFYISWMPLFSIKSPNHLKKLEPNFIGYDVFKLVNAKFIPKQPINQRPVVANFFIDNKVEKNCQISYTVQPLFKFDKHVLHGPTSQIVKCP